MNDPRDILAQRMRALQRPAAAVPIIVKPPAPPPPPPPLPDPDEGLTLKQAAKLLKVSIPTLKKSGIPIAELGPRTLRIRRSDMNRFLMGCVLQK